MKNLKKVLALVVALTMVLGTVAFAGYTDVAEDAGEYTAVSTLSSLGILTGYEDGSFKPEGDITRAEFCAVVCRALGAKVSGSAVTAFSDVPADHWASAYISYVAGLGIVNGMGDGTFAPDANVTFEQAVKMLVVALGYEPMAAQKGGYPTGYMVVANTYEITEGISAVQSAPAPRGIVAQLVYNALDVPVMEQTGFGTNISYESLDGTSGKAYKTLLTNLKVVKLDGSVVKTEVIGGADKGYVDFAITEEYGSSIFAAEETFKVGEGVDAESYFGYASTVFVKKLSNNKYEIIAIMPGAESTIVELGLEDIDTIDTTKVEYYTDADKYDTKKLTLDDTAITSAAGVYLNYAEVGVNALNTAIGVANDMEITVIENTGDNKYDMIIAKEYSYDRVDEIELDRDRFSTAAGNTFVFDFEDEDKTITLVDENGEAIELSDFEANDVIAYISSGTTRAYTWIEVINLGNKSVTGTVDETKTDAVFVDGVEYGKAGVGTINLGDEGTFYLTRTDKIFDFEKSSSVAGNYGYILGTALVNNGGWDDAWEVKMLTKDNEVVTYTVRDGFDVIINSGAGQYTYEDIDQADSAAAILSTLKIENFVGDDDAFKTVNVADRLVTYKLDSKGLIREIAAANVSLADTDDYNADAEKLFTAFESDAVIFNLTGNKETSAFVTNASSLVDGNTYTGYYVTNDDLEVDCLIITVGAASIDFTQDLAIVTSVTTTKVNEEDAKKVRYYVSGEDELKELIIMDDSTVSEPINCSISAVKVGAIMMFTADGDNVASAYTVLANTLFEGADETDSSAQPYSVGSVAAEITSAGSPLYTEDVSFAFGYIDDKAKVSKGTKITDGLGNDYVILGSTNTYTIKDDDSSKARVYVGDWAALASVDTKVGHADGKANYFIAKIVDDKVADFITFSRAFQID